jgi:hypothetical protein
MPDINHRYALIGPAVILPRLMCHFQRANMDDKKRNQVAQIRAEASAAPMNPSSKPRTKNSDSALPNKQKVDGAEPVHFMLDPQDGLVDATSALLHSK